MFKRLKGYFQGGEELLFVMCSYKCLVVDFHCSISRKSSFSINDRQDNWSNKFISLCEVLAICSTPSPYQRLKT